MSVTAARAGMFRGHWLLHSAHKGTAGPQGRVGRRVVRLRGPILGPTVINRPGKGTCLVASVARGTGTWHSSPGLWCGKEATELLPPWD